MRKANAAYAPAAPEWVVMTDPTATPVNLDALDAAVAELLLALDDAPTDDSGRSPAPTAGVT
jgi:hypothetical protein